METYVRIGEEIGVEGMIVDRRFYAWDSVGFETRLSPDHQIGLKNIGIVYEDIGMCFDDFQSGKKSIMMKYSQFCYLADCIDDTGKVIPERMYFHARYALFFSMDNGNTWRFGGIPIGPSSDESSLDSGVIWSGSFLSIEDGTVICVYTGVPRHTPTGAENDLSEYVLQTIMGAISVDGGFTFKKIDEPILSAVRDYDWMISKGYYFGEVDRLGLENDPDGTHMTLRDMQLVRKSNGALWGYFAAKAVSQLSESGIEPCIGQVRFKNAKMLSDGIDEIGKPIILPNDKSNKFNQLECPNIVLNQQGESIVVASLAQHWEIGQMEKQAHKEVKVFKVKESEDGTLCNMRPYGPAVKGGNTLLTNEVHGLYALCIMNHDGNPKSGIYNCAAFQLREDHKFQYPNFLLNVNDNKPSVSLPDLNKYNHHAKLHLDFDSCQ